MPAWKALLFVAVGILVLATATFTIVPSTRPPVVKKWFRQAAGFTPAKTPDECLTKFKDCVKKRDYETAAELYCTGEYREQVLKVAAGAKKLGDAIDALVYQMDKHGVINPKTTYILRLLEPFPTDFSVKSIGAESNSGVVAVIEINNPLPKVDSPVPANFFNDHGYMIGSLMPAAQINAVPLVKEADGTWRINFAVVPRLRESVEKLRTGGGTNYANAIFQVRDEIRNDPGTKEAVQRELERRLNESK